MIEEGTRPMDSYEASSINTSGYINLEMPFNRLEIHGGLRVEYNVQNLENRDDFGEIHVHNPVLSILPYLNSSYRLSERSQLRLAYGRTVNRPEFRELAPFLFYDYKMDCRSVWQS